MVEIQRWRGSTLKQGIAWVAVRCRPEVRSRTRSGTVTWSEDEVCVDVPGSTTSERRAVALAVVEQFMAEAR
jgi:hypothetical protein